MGQSGRIRGGEARIHSRQSVANRVLRLAVFPTQCGWFGLLGNGNQVQALTIGHSSADEVRRRIGQLLPRNSDESSEIEDEDWSPQLRRQLERYASGDKIGFTDVDVVLPGTTPFQQRVLALTRQIEYGHVLSYGELAREAGRPGAARAVGNVMASNRIPIIIPCHRVVAAGGGWGGFSAPQGVSLKQHLLEMEGATLATCLPR